MKILTGMVLGVALTLGAEVCTVIKAREFYLHKAPGDNMIQLNENYVELNPQKITTIDEPMPRQFVNRKTVLQRLKARGYVK